MTRDNSYLIGNQFAKGSKPNKTSFQKGQAPWNKGLRGRHFSPDTEFKKGHSQVKYEIGEIRIRITKKGKPRNFIKIGQPNTWVELAKHLWVEKYGLLIKGDITHHLDGESLHDIIENIIAMPRKDHPCFHGRWGLKPLSQEQIDYYISRYTSK